MNKVLRLAIFVLLAKTRVLLVALSGAVLLLPGAAGAVNNCTTTGGGNCSPGCTGLCTIGGLMCVAKWEDLYLMWGAFGCPLWFNIQSAPTPQLEEGGNGRAKENHRFC